MTPDLLRDTGEALYGPLWQSELARRLGVADRTVRRWVSGQRPIPTGLAEPLQEMARERIGTLKLVIASLKRTGTAG